MSLLHLDALARKLNKIHLDGTRKFNVMRDEKFTKELEEDLRKGGGLSHKLTKPPQPPRDMTGFDSVQAFMETKAEQLRSYELLVG